MSDDAQVTVTRDDDAGRYEVAVDGTLAGFTEFRELADGRLMFPHTEVFPEFGGRGLAGTLVDAAMRDVAARGVAVVPVCPYVVKYLRAHEIPGLQVDFRDEE